MNITGARSVARISRRSSEPLRQADFAKFKTYLDNQQYTKKAKSGLMGYAQIYHAILFDGDAKTL